MTDSEPIISLDILYLHIRAVAIKITLSLTHKDSISGISKIND